MARFYHRLRTGAFGRRLGINASILPNSLPRSCAQVADSKASGSGSLTSIEVILRGGFKFDLNMFKTF